MLPLTLPPAASALAAATSRFRLGRVPGEDERFAAEPLFSKTGRGYLKGEGVATLNKIKSNLRRKVAAKFE